MMRKLNLLILLLLLGACNYTDDHFKSYDLLKENGTIEINDDLMHYYDSDGFLDSKECTALGEMSDWYRVIYKVDELSFRVTPDDQ